MDRIVWAVRSYIGTEGPVGTHSHEAGTDGVARIPEAARGGMTPLGGALGVALVLMQLRDGTGRVEQGVAADEPGEERDRIGGEDHSAVVVP